MIENQNGKRILLLGVYGMELVECGGALLKNAKSGGVSHASMLFCGEQMRKDLAKSAEILQTTVEYLNMDSGAVTGSREERLWGTECRHRTVSSNFTGNTTIHHKSRFLNNCHHKR